MGRLGGGGDLVLDGGLVLVLHLAGEGGAVLLHKLLRNLQLEGKNAFFQAKIRLINSFSGPFFGAEIGFFSSLFGVERLEEK